MAGPGNQSTIGPNAPAPIQAVGQATQNLATNLTKPGYDPSFSSISPMPTGGTGGGKGGGQVQPQSSIANQTANTNQLITPQQPATLPTMGIPNMGVPPTTRLTAPGGSIGPNGEYTPAWSGDIRPPSRGPGAYAPGGFMYNQMQPTQPFAGGVPTNVMESAAQGLRGAMQGTSEAMGYQPQMVGTSPFTPMVGTGGQTGMVRTPSATYFGGGAQQVGTGGTTPQVQAGQLASTNLSAYTNPYESQVVSQALGDIERQRQIQQQQTSAAAQRAGAFGGSRQGVAEAETNRAFAEQSAKTAAALRQAGFTQAQQMAQQDIATQMQAGLANQAAAQSDLARQLQAQGMNQQAAEAEAARRLQASTSTGQMGLQASLANQQAMAGDLARQLQAQGMNQSAAQQTAQRMLQANLANQTAGLSGAQFRLGAANQLGQLANLGFGMGNTISDRLMAQGQQQQNLQQQLIQAAQARYGQYTGYPQQGIGLLSQALGQTPTPQTTTTSSSPGMFDYATLMALAKVGPFSDIRLKEDVSKVGEWKGLNIYRWKWNDKAKEVGADKYVEIGVIAQELKETHPEAVFVGDDGYYRVNYEAI